jgi:hypothetical protein
MNGEAEVVEKKLGMSLDELIAEQKKKQGTRAAAGGKKKPVGGTVNRTPVFFPCILALHRV